MKRTYHTWDKWECYPAGMYEPKAPGGMNAKEANLAYADFLRDIPMFEAALSKVTREWVRSCEHYLSNEKMNRIAWLGQASVCAALGIPRAYRGGFNMLTEQEQRTANEAALKWLNLWLRRQGEPEVDMEQAGISAQVDIY